MWTSPKQMLKNGKSYFAIKSSEFYKINIRFYSGVQRTNDVFHIVNKVENVLVQPT